MDEFEEFAEEEVVEQEISDVDIENLPTGSNYMSKISSIPVLTPEEEYTTALRYLHDKDPVARETMIIHNLRLVAFFVPHYIGKGLSTQDLIQEGNIGLIRAVESFDCTKGYRFSTYASWWINQAMRRAIDNTGSMIRVPAYVHEQLAKIKKAEAQIMAASGKQASLFEIEMATGLTAKQIETAKHSEILSSTISLSISIGDSDSDGILEDLIADERKNVSQTVQEKMRNDKIKKLVTQILSEKEADIIIARYGLDGFKPRTLDDIGQEIGLTKERVRQIQNNALMKLRKNKEVKQLAAAFDLT